MKSTLDTALGPSDERSSPPCYQYAVYGLRLTSNVPLPQLMPAAFDETDIGFEYVRWERGFGLVSQSAVLQASFPTTLGDQLSMYHSREGMILRWEGKFDFQVADHGQMIRCATWPGISGPAMLATFYGAVLSFALHLRGVTNLHASAIVTPGGAVGFLADPGGGKSTLAAAFAKSGYPFLTDDLLALEEGTTGYIAYPGFPALSLTERSFRGLFGVDSGVSNSPSSERKRRIPVRDHWAQFQSTPARLRGLAILNRGPEGAPIDLTWLPRVEGLRGLLQHTNCLSLLPQDLQKRQMHFLAKLTAYVPVWSFTYPASYQHAHDVVRTLLRSTGERV